MPLHLRFGRGGFLRFSSKIQRSLFAKTGVGVALGRPGNAIGARNDDRRRRRPTTHGILGSKISFARRCAR